MKKVTLIAIMLLAFIVVKAQVHIGYTSAEIQKDMPNIAFKKGIAEDNTKYISCTIDGLYWIYYFDKEGVTFLNALVPSNQKQVNELVSVYNKTKVVISNTKWRNYTNGIVIITELSFSKSTNLFVFTFYVDPK